MRFLAKPDGQLGQELLAESHSIAGRSKRLTLLDTIKNGSGPVSYREFKGHQAQVYLGGDGRSLKVKITQIRTRGSPLMTIYFCSPGVCSCFV